jgi:pimeloyl-ACP methyl ester carboxylesterase
MWPVDVPETRYARSGDLQIAYQVVGEGPLDVVLVSSYLSNIELFWELPSYSGFLERLSSFSRLILFERRGSGMSDARRPRRTRPQRRARTVADLRRRDVGRMPSTHA